MRPTFLSIFATTTTLAAGTLIQDVTQENFATLLKDNTLSLIAFTSDTLAAVQPFHKTFSQAANSVKTPFILIDCDTQTELCKQYDVNSYPTVRLFKGKRKEGEDKEGDGIEIIRYRGRRTKNAIKSFVTKYEQPVLSKVEPENLAEFKKIDDVVIVAYLRPDQTSLLDIFKAVAEKHYQEFVFGYSVDMATADAEGLAMPSIVCYKNTDGDNKVMNGHFGEAEVEQLLEMAKKNLIGEFSEKDIESFMARDKLTVYAFATTEDEALTLRHELTPVAKRYEKFAIFAIADAVEFSPMAQSFGLTGDKFPSLAVHAPINDNIFTYQQGRKISGLIVDTMLKTILQGQAVSGQVFGSEAPEMEDTEVAHEGPEHSEL